jgi:predicted metal-dependent hydrolase
MLPQAFWQGIEEFNQQQFYACHDTLEALWLEASEPQKAFYQGILQIAVGCYHLGNHNWRGAVILLGEGVRRLDFYIPVYENIDVTQFINESTQLLKTLQQIQPDRVAEFTSDAAIDKTAQTNELDDGQNPVYRLPKILQIS